MTSIYEITPRHEKTKLQDEVDEFREFKEMYERSRELDRKNRASRAFGFFLIYVIPLGWPAWMMLYLYWGGS